MSEHELDVERPSDYFLSGANFERKKIMELIDNMMSDSTFDTVDNPHQAVDLVRLAITLREPSEV